jgi:broad specificity phosphatase PhoE
LKEYDPHLTQIGQQQAFYLGESLAKELQGKKMLIISSPYRRCLETAESFLNGMQINTLYNDKCNLLPEKIKACPVIDRTIFVEDAARERQDEAYFTAEEYNHIHFMKGEKIIHLETRYNSLECLNPIRHVGWPWPETRQDYLDRSYKTLDQLAEFMSKKENANIVPIIITHGFFTTALIMKFENRYENRYVYGACSKLELTSEGKFRPVYLNQKLY